MSFEPINTQEEFDAAVKDRLAREAKKYEGYTSPEDLEKIKEDIKAEYDSKFEDLSGQIDSVNQQLAERDKSIEERDAKIKGYETNSVKMRIARETGLSYEAVDYLKGDDEKAIRESAESLKALIGNKSAPPLGDPEPAAGDSKDSAFLKLSRELKGEE